MRPRAVPSATVEWTLVTVRRPCRVCGSGQRCRSGSGGEFACCATLPSEWPLTIGGWVHRIGEVDVEGERAGAAPGGA